MLYLATEMILIIIMSIRMNYTCYINGLSTANVIIYHVHAFNFNFFNISSALLCFFIALALVFHTGSALQNVFIAFLAAHNVFAFLMLSGAIFHTCAVLFMKVAFALQVVVTGCLRTTIF